MQAAMADHTVPQGRVCGSIPFSSPFFPPFSGGHFLDTPCDRGGFTAGVIRCGDRSTGAMRSPAHPRCRCGPGMQQDAQPWRWSPGAESPLSPLLWQRFSFPSSPPWEGAAGLQGSYGLKDLNASNPLWWKIRVHFSSKFAPEAANFFNLLQGLVILFSKTHPIEGEASPDFSWRAPMQRFTAQENRRVLGLCRQLPLGGNLSSEHEDPLLTPHPSSADGQHPGIRFRWVLWGRWPPFTGRKFTIVGTLS